MGADIFEGYIGIRVGDEQFVYDTLLILVILLLSLFGFVFRFHYPLFLKMLNELFSTRERQNLFVEPVKNNLFCMGFLNFQALFLCSLFFYLVFCNYTEIQDQHLLSIVGTIGVFFGIIYAFYLIKQCIYVLYGRVFSENGKYKLWSANYHILTYLWGILIYFPVFWLLFEPDRITEALVTFAACYVIFRITLIYMTIRIFYNKNTGLLYLSSYLCAQEIIPLLFLYEGLNYLYNAIEASTLWH
jgi:hypothetical protein